MPFLVTGQMMLPLFPSPPEMCAVLPPNTVRNGDGDGDGRGDGARVKLRGREGGLGLKIDQTDVGRWKE